MSGIPTSIPADLRLSVEADLRLVVRMAVQSLGRRSANYSDRRDAEVAAERIIEAIQKFNYVATISQHQKMGNVMPRPAEPVGN